MNPSAGSQGSASGPEPPPPLRAAWLHLAGLLLAVAVAVLLTPAIVHAVSLTTIVAALGLTGLVCYFPLRRLSTLENLVVPLWWDLFYFTSVLAFLWALLVGDARGMLVMGVPTIVLNILLCVLIWLIEYRHPVRVYTSGRRYVFVPSARPPVAPASSERRPRAGPR